MTADQGGYTGPSKHDPPLRGLEIWLIGTPADVDAALSVLRDAGRHEFTGRAHRMAGTDSGRVRRYLRISRTPGAHAHGGRAGVDRDDQAVIDLTEFRDRPHRRNRQTW